jgi:competence ComEA-like helix-hairpin-helix protein
MKLTFILEPENRLTISLFLCLFVVSHSSCIKQPRSVRVLEYERGAQASTAARPIVNINSAPRKDLESLPGIGPGLATRIIEHREKYGRFRRVEHLIMVRGLSDRRFRKLRSFVVA